MMQVVDNRSAVRGQVEQSEPAGNETAVTLRVEAADPVAGYPNLLASKLDQRITVRVPAGTIPPPEPGALVQWTVRAAGLDRYFLVAEGSGPE
jgi:hypothetical protein